MPVIDLHAHVTPNRYKKAIERTGYWYGLDRTAGEIDRGGFAQPLEERLEEMDRFGVDMQLVTPTVGFYQYENSLEVTKMVHRECADEIEEMFTEHPDRFLGMGMVPMQDPPTAISELESLIERGFKGIILNDHVAGVTYDDPRYLPFFAAAESLGALLFFHQGGQTITTQRNPKYKLPNAVGNLTERTMLYATLVFGGVLDKHPNLRMLLGHGGGYTPYGVARMDKVAGALPPEYDGEMKPPFPGDDGFNNEKPPSEYLDRFYYDCCTYSGPVLRFLVDTVGIERVVLGTDYPAPMFLYDPVNWVRDLPELTEEEKDAILVGNSNQLLGI